MALEGVMITYFSKVTILVGYKTAAEVPEDTITNRYLRSGCAMQLGIREGSPGSVDDIASAVLQICPVILEVLEHSYIWYRVKYMYL